MRTVYCILEIFPSFVDHHFFIMMMMMMKSATSVRTQLYKTIQPILYRFVCSSLLLLLFKYVCVCVLFGVMWRRLQFSSSLGDDWDGKEKDCIYAHIPQSKRSKTTTTTHTNPRRREDTTHRLTCYIYYIATTTPLLPNISLLVSWKSATRKFRNKRQKCIDTRQQNETRRF